MTFPTVAEQNGNFAGLQTGGIFDPSTQQACSANSTDGPCRYRYGYSGGTGKGSRGNPIQTGPVDVIPASQISQVVKNLQSFLPTGIGTSATGNYVSPNFTALTNWSTTDRIDYNMTSKDTLTVLAAIGRQASAVPQGQTTSGRNVGPVPYNYGQAFAPKTAVGIIKRPTSSRRTSSTSSSTDTPATTVPPIIPTMRQLTLPTQSELPVSPWSGGRRLPYVTFAGTEAPTNLAVRGQHHHR